MKTLKSTIEKAVMQGMVEGMGKTLPFELEKLKVPTVPHIYQYLKSIGINDTGFEPRFLGEGSSRVALLISSNKVLKIPLINSKEALHMGLMQNQKEAEISKKYPDYTPRLWAADANGKWLLTEPVKEFDSRKEFEEQFGGKSDAFFSWIKICLESMEKYGDIASDNIGLDMAADLNSFETPEKLEKLGLTQNIIQKFAESKWVNGLIKMIKQENMYLPDILSYSAWGKTASGKVVLFDTGTTDAIYHSFSFESVLGENINERIRTQFDMREFKSLNTLFSVKTYAQETLGNYELGKDMGSSRMAFLLGPKKVLKIARNMKAGLAQNLAEIEIFKKFPDFVTKIFDYNQHGMWILTEPVREFNEQDDFEQIKGYKLLDLKQWVQFFVSNRVQDDVIQSYDKLWYVFRNTGYWIPEESFEKIFDDPWAMDLVEFYKNADLASGDFWSISHWGKTAEGRIVLLDSGGTEEVLQKYY